VLRAGAARVRLPLAGVARVDRGPGRLPGHGGPPAGRLLAVVGGPRMGHQVRAGDSERVAGQPGEVPGGRDPQLAGLAADAVRRRPGNPAVLAWEIGARARSAAEAVDGGVTAARAGGHGRVPRVSRAQGPRTVRTNKNMKGEGK